ncbi:SDR family NAD(P)-dependent oxidoreductase [Actinokineospora bangkokensis]|uniref:Uncharacterized protein n=1 Tax=Actinokineospora bangkokensis TaxID=1193682 RepID=A0A1Q9LM33_9PSEU|nr:SDR family NAD(P)-dependent oxidoreductase [Actinokineospora bangkokensis]OLR93053.1 hypothetical protein BJP25_19060 [Actinokineospora bangkokensis]
MSQTQEPVAVIGMAATMPGADDLDQFWTNLRAGRNCITYGPRVVVADEREGTRRVHARGVLGDVRRFDHEFFGIPRREAEVLDPQHRVLLEHSWAAMEDAGYDPHRLRDKVAVYTTAGPNTYKDDRDFGAESAAERLLVDLSNAPDTLSTRISYKLGLTGESLSVRTACSSSLVAIHLAAEAVRSGRVGFALAGAVNIRCWETLAYEQQDGFILSADGHTRAYDHRGTGYVEGDGVGVVLLRRLSDALAAGDHVHAVIRSGGINNDGKAKAGFSAPGVEGQSAAIGAALAGAGVPAESIHMVEGHGTGTAVGDPIEVRALTRAYRAHTDRTGFCALGSVKANIGHLGYASGMAGLLKAVLAVKHGEIPPLPDFEAANPEIDFASSPFFPVTEARPFPEGPRRAGVSSFGMGGTNVHVIVEQAPAVEPAGERPAAPRAVVLSARTEQALAQVRARLADWLVAHPDADLADVAFTLATGRKPQPVRWTTVASTVDELVAVLRGAAPNAHTGEATELAQAWAGGMTIDWAGYYAGTTHRRVPLPTYPWQGEELWVPVVGGDARGTDPDAPEPVADWVYRQVWTRTALPRPHHPGDLTATAGACVVLGDGGALDTAVRSELAAAGLTVVPVELAEAFDTSPAGVVGVRPGDPADLARAVEHVIAAHGAITRVVHLWDHAAAGADLSVGVLGTLSLVQALTAARQAPELWVLTRDAQPVGDALDLRPEGAALLGLCQVVPQEHPDLTCRGIDVTDGADPRRTAAQLLAEMASPGTDQEIAYRGADRHVPSFAKLDGAGGVATPVRPGGAYLVAGAGRMGTAIAEHLAAAGATRIALLSRRGTAPGTDRFPAGTEVWALAADLADEAAVADAVARVTERWGPISGLVHAAGADASGGLSLLADTTPGSAADLLAPKTAGLLALDRATRAQPLDFALVCASLSTVLGGITFGAYTAANRFLDAHAELRRAQGAPWVGVDWDVWGFPGTAAAASPTAMAVEQATGLLGALVSEGGGRLVVSTTALGPRVARVRAALAGGGGSGGGPLLTSVEQLRDALMDVVADLVGLDDLEEDDELLAIGCDSLTFLEALARWGNRIGVKVPIARLWGCRTFTDLAEAGWAVVREVGAPAGPEAAAQALRHLAG